MSDDQLQQNKRVVARLFDEVFYGPSLNWDAFRPDPRYRPADFW